MTLATPIEMEVFETIGSSALRGAIGSFAAGGHARAESLNAGLELADKRTVKIAAGKRSI